MNHVKVCEKHPKAKITKLRTGDDVCSRCLDEEYAKYGDTFASVGGQRDMFDEKLIDNIMSSSIKQVPFPCPACQRPNKMLCDPDEFHVDPPMCKECWAIERPRFLRGVREALVEKRSKFSRSSPGIGKRKNDV
jgi:hypothetical protein